MTPLGEHCRIDLPDRPEYESTAAHKLDEALANGVIAADEIGDGFLAEVLELHLAGHRVQHRGDDDE